MKKHSDSEIRRISGSFLVTAIGYFLAARIGLAFVAQPEGIATIWLPSGIALAALLLAQNRAARSASVAAIFCACLSANLVAGNTLAVSLGFAFANTLEPILAAVILTRLVGDSVTFTRMREITALIGVVISANAVTALVGAAVPTLAFGAPFWNTWLVWWVADGLGILVLTPLIVAWMPQNRFNKPITIPRIIEGTIITIALTTIALVGATDSPPSPAMALFRPYSLTVLLVYIALRFSPRGVSVFFLIISAIVIRQTIDGDGIFNLFAPTFTLQLLFAQMFLGIASITTLALSALLNERALAEAHLRESEHNYRTLMEQAADGIFVADTNGNHIDVNSQGCAMTGYTRAEILGMNLRDLLPPKDLATVSLQLKEFPMGKTAVHEQEIRRKDGSVFPAEVSAKQLDDGRLQGIIRDITARIRGEQALRDSEERYRVLFREMLDGFALHEIICDDTGAPCDYRFLEMNPAFEQLTGLRASELVGKTVRQVIPGIKSKWIALYGKVAQTGEPAHFESYIHSLGKYFEVTASSPKRGQFATIIADITARHQRKRQVEAIVMVSAALRAAPTRAEMLPIIVDQITALLNTTGAAIGLFDGVTGESVIIHANGSWASAIGRRVPPNRGVSGHVTRTRQYYLTHDLLNDPLFYSRDLIGAIRGAACLPLIARDTVTGWLFAGVETTLTEVDLQILSAIADIAASALHRAELHEETERSLARLTALNVIDRAINASLDLSVTLDILLDQIVTQLRADAAAILLFNRTTQALECRAERGMRGTGISRAPVYLGNDATSRAVLNRQMVNVPDLITSGNAIARAHLLAGEGFIAYYAVPLIAKGHVKGVLEIFQRAPHTPSSEWIDFLGSLAEQAALALDNAELFNGLQKTNAELILAYDATIEGWSHALDLRDRETEGHTQRVTEMAIRLAQAMRIPQDALIHLRRGALLHDIGKLGIPDAILLKPDSLTESEWETMRLHPSYAYELLAPIAYLRPAANIPYCHHEKWDGTGYPRKLGGAQIPLAARIFAIVDVWDALSSDRPYRAAWPSDQVIDYLRDQAGKHFDPEVVEVFLRLLQSK